MEINALDWYLQYLRKMIALETMHVRLVSGHSETLPLKEV